VSLGISSDLVGYRSKCGSDTHCHNMDGSRFSEALAEFNEQPVSRWRFLCIYLAILIVTCWSWSGASLVVRMVIGKHLDCIYLALHLRCVPFPRLRRQIPLFNASTFRLSERDMLRLSPQTSLLPIPSSSHPAPPPPSPNPLHDYALPHSDPLSQALALPSAPLAVQTQLAHSHLIGLS